MKILILLAVVSISSVIFFLQFKSIFYTDTKKPTIGSHYNRKKIYAHKVKKKKRWGK